MRAFRLQDLIFLGTILVVIGALGWLSNLYKRDKYNKEGLHCLSRLRNFSRILAENIGLDRNGMAREWTHALKQLPMEPYDLICPADKSRNAATSIDTFSISNISYAISISAAQRFASDGVTALDSNCYPLNGKTVKITGKELSRLEWIPTLYHGKQGNVALANGAVITANDKLLKNIFVTNSPVTLVMPP